LFTSTSSDSELLGHEVQHRDRDVEGVLQERPHPADRDELETEPEVHVLAAVTLDQRPIFVIEEEHALQVSMRRHPRVPAVRHRLIISQELHRHTPQSRTDPPVTNAQPPNR
jgi:hypothetical protein